MRKVLIAGNWKMYKTQSEAVEFLQKFLPQLDQTPEEREIVLCASFTTLTALSKNLHGSRVRVGAQNIHWEDFGAYTGAISGPMLAELGVRYVIVGHSERRQYAREIDNPIMSQRLKAAQRHGITPILCVGETKEQRSAGKIESHIYSQLETDLVEVDQQNLVIAYEPIWAIGTGETCPAGEANRVIGLIRSQLSNPSVTIQYGGSVKSENIDEIMAQPEVDGALVGGASLQGDSFARIVNYQPI